MGSRNQQYNIVKCHSRTYLTVFRLIVMLKLLEHSLQTMNVHVVVSVLSPALLMLVFMMLPVCDLVKEVLRLLRPPPLTYGRADRSRRGKVEHTAGSELGELGHTDCYILQASSSFILLFLRPLVAGVVTDQLMEAFCEITLWRERTVEVQLRHQLRHKTKNKSKFMHP